MMDDEMLDTLRRVSDRADKVDPKVRFQRLVDAGIIYADGRLRPEITGRPEADEARAIPRASKRQAKAKTKKPAPR